MGQNRVNRLPDMPILGSSNSSANKDLNMMSLIWKNGDIISFVRKHSGKRTNCSLWAISPFPRMFSKAVCCWCIKMSIYRVKGWKENLMLVSPFTLDVFKRLLPVLLQYSFREIWYIIAQIDEYNHLHSAWDGKKVKMLKVINYSFSYNVSMQYKAVYFFKFFLIIYHFYCWRLGPKVISTVLGGWS